MKLDIVDRLKLLARGDNLDLADIVCADAIEVILSLLCSDCPPTDYVTDKTRCGPCPRRKLNSVPPTEGS
jgi:hypothetical protein